MGGTRRPAGVTFRRLAYAATHVSSCEYPLSTFACGMCSTQGRCCRVMVESVHSKCASAYTSLPHGASTRPYLACIWHRLVDDCRCFRLSRAQRYRVSAGRRAADEDGTESALSLSNSASPFSLTVWRSDAERQAVGRPLVQMTDRFIFKVLALAPASDVMASAASCSRCCLQICSPSRET